jgi:hypothetical protein
MKRNEYLHRHNGIQTAGMKESWKYEGKNRQLCPSCPHFHEHGGDMITVVCVVSKYFSFLITY